MIHIKYRGGIFRMEVNKTMIWGHFVHALKEEMEISGPLYAFTKSAQIIKHFEPLKTSLLRKMREYYTPSWNVRRSWGHPHRRLKTGGERGLED